MLYVAPGVNCRQAATTSAGVRFADDVDELREIGTKYLTELALGGHRSTFCPVDGVGSR